MSGPSVSVLLRGDLEPEGVAWVRSLVEGVASSTECGPARCAFWVADGRALGVGYEGPGLPFEVSFRDVVEEYADVELNELCHGIGWMPRHEVAFTAFTSGDASCKVVAALAVETARRFEGMINLTSPVTPKGRSWHGAPRAEVRAYAHVIPGKLIEVEYDGDEGWFYHVVDADYLAAWASADDFLLV